MLDKTESHENHLAYFVSNNIDVSKPGFYDDANFIKLEQTNTTILDNYASFVGQKNYNNDYLSNAEKVIKDVAVLLYGMLCKDGRQGACIDTSMVMSRILEKEGIWNYQAKGSLTINFPAATNINPKYFYTIDRGNYVAAHSWVVAPPYKIIDLTVRQQSYKEVEKTFLPDYILQKDTKSSTMNLKDIIEPSILSVFNKRFGNDKKNILKAISPNLLSFSKRFKPEIFEQKGVMFKYSPTGVLAPSLPFEKTTSLQLNGLYGIQIYNQFIKPRLK